MRPNLPQRRIDAMVRRYGPGDPKQDCAGCVSLIHAPKGTRKDRRVCHAAGDVEWRLYYPSCGAYRRPANYDAKQLRGGR